MPFEHFGISVVEAMSAGCVPVVNQSGGPWLDILDAKQGEYGFAYRSLKEAAEFVRILIDNEKFRRKIALNAFGRAKIFDRTVFMRKMIEVVEKIAG